MNHTTLASQESDSKSTFARYRMYLAAQIQEVRELEVEHTANPITISKSLRQLELKGILIRQRDNPLGKACKS